MFRIFNSIQFVGLLVAWPYIIQWLNTVPFGGAGAIVYVAYVVYVIMFCLTIGAVADSTERWKW
jgi:hypothetical protein